MDFEEPKAGGSDAADRSELMDLYRAASQALSAAPNVGDSLSSRDGDMLGVNRAALQGSRHQRALWPDAGLGRTARVRDLRISEGCRHAASMATTPSTLVLKARLSDVGRPLDRKKAALGNAAILTYLESPEKSKQAS